MLRHSEIIVISKRPLRQDVKLTASNDDYYFVFEDFLYQVGSLLSLLTTPGVVFQKML